MNKLLKQNPLLWASGLSFLLSLALNFHDVVNLDGILYLNAAKAFAEQNYTQAFSIYGWAFYPAMIAGLSQLTTLSLENSAILINAGFMALMASGFVALVRTLGGSQAIQWTAVLIFLIHPGINDYREYILRDFGAWALLIWSLVFLCRFSIKPSWPLVVGWTVSITLSVLFRPENIIWLALGPFALLFSMHAVPLKKRWQALFYIKSLFLIAAAGALFSLTWLNISVPTTKLHAMFMAYYNMITSGVSIYAEKAQAFSEMMSVYFKFDHAMIVLGMALIFYGVFLTLKLLSPLYVALIGYGLFHRPLIKKPETRILLWMLIVYASIYLIFLGKNFFISSRYLIPWVTVAMVWVPFALALLWPRAPGALKATIGLVMLYMLLDSVLSFGYSKMYLKEAGLWINHNTPTQALLYTDSNHVAYYADRPLTRHAENADVIALLYNRKTPEVCAGMDGFSDKPQVDFHNKRHDGVRVIVK